MTPTTLDFSGTEASVFLIEDDRELRSDIEHLLCSAQFKVYPFSNPKEFLNANTSSIPAVIVSDMRMPEMSGVELQAELLKQGRTTPIIFISGQSSDHQIISAFKEGAVDFLLKPFSWKALQNAVTKAIERDILQMKTIAHKKLLNQKLAMLTLREHQVFDLLLAGCKNQEIAEKLHLSNPTVKQHKSSVLDKLNVKSVSELFTLAKTKIEVVSSDLSG